MSWFRLHTNLIHHPVVATLPADIFKAWIKILCLAKDGNGTIPNVKEVAFQLRCGLSSAERWTSELVNNYGLLESNEDGTFHPKNWNRHQYKSDVSTERVKQFRERKGNVSETPSEYRVQSTEEKPPNPLPQKPRRGKRKAHRLETPFSFAKIPDDWSMFAIEKFGWDHWRCDREFIKIETWARKDGGLLRSDWMATWRNWVAKSEENKPTPKRTNGALPGEWATTPMPAWMDNPPAEDEDFNLA